MFTGIVKAKGRLRATERVGGDVRMSIVADSLPWSSYAVGDSIAVNGVCLTVTALHADGFDTDVSIETLDVTSLEHLHTGDVVNLEPALAVGDRLGGHLVSGHVDCVGEVRTCDADARSIRLVIAIPAEYARYIARKGSVCVDGVSLTVNEVSDNTFGVNIIPHTADATIIGDYTIGTAVNIEVDVLARYLERLLGNNGDELSIEFLRAHGYA